MVMRSRVPPAKSSKAPEVGQNKQEVGDFSVQQERTVMRGGVSVLTSALALYLGSYWLPRLVSFPTDRLDAIAFSLQVNIIPIVILMIAVRMVAKIRFTNEQDNRGSAFGTPSQNLAVHSAFLQNTLEQAVIAIAANTALASVGGPAASAYITVGALLFVIGRVLFLVGYPYGAGGRAFGMVMTVVPSLGATFWVIISWFR